jgi:hypothetical protein
MRAMKRFTSKRMLATGGVVAAVVLGGGAAIANSSSGSASPSAFLDSVAQHLGISSKKLNDAVKAASIDQVNEALKEGRITKTQADALKARIESGQAPLLGRGLLGPGRFGFGFHSRGMHEHGDHLSSAANYLGLTEAQLRAKLFAGQSLAEVAKAQGKSVDGLKKAILDAAQKKLDQAVSDGTLTKAQASELSDRLKSKIDDIVNGIFERRFPHPGFFGGPPPGSDFRGFRSGGQPRPFFGTSA